MIERFLAQTTFTSEEDFKEHLKFKTKEDFNFAYDVMDAWAEEMDYRKALKDILMGMIGYIKGDLVNIARKMEQDSKVV